MIQLLGLYLWKCGDTMCHDDSEITVINLRTTLHLLLFIVFL